MFGLWLHLAKSSYGSLSLRRLHPQNYKKIEMKNTVLASLSTSFNMCELWMAELWCLIAFIRNCLLHFWNYFRIGEPPVLVPCTKKKRIKEPLGPVISKTLENLVFFMK
jgi:hypothetical protein